MNHTVKPKMKGSKQLFSNPLLERLSRTHISIPLTLYSVISIGLLYYGATEIGLQAGMMVLMFVLGFLFLTLLEYVAHRYVFHMEPTNKVKAKIQYTVHGVHHEYPKDKDRLAMPPILALLYVAIFFIVFRFALGDYVYAFVPGLLMGYATYLFVHFAVHAYQPPKNFLKILWVHHAIHHYKDPERAYGVSSPLWDYVFGTMPK
ncbi:sterol desaturase family protein [Cesiribacter sp. SM1]|uniref:sterol desaturase family protein n=1 Tax=Cesiribacter sp. SM1 TaxID=2861196 RepID=UPI001CD7C8F8|nr:sterol desaturase family protein [Cesiribacter sp. SM1]